MGRGDRNGDCCCEDLENASIEVNGGINDGGCKHASGGGAHDILAPGAGAQKEGALAPAEALPQGTALSPGPGTLLCSPGLASRPCGGASHVGGPDDTDADEAPPTSNPPHGETTCAGNAGKAIQPGNS